MSNEIIHESESVEWSDFYLFVQGFFYFSQGIMQIMILMMPIFLQSLGVAPAESIAVMSLVQIPWYIKILYGIISDNVSFKKYGRRRPYIVIAGIFGIIAAIWIPTFTSFNVLFVVAGMFLSFSVAFSDAILDSLAVDVTPDNRRFLMQGIGWGGRGLGAALGGFIFGSVAAEIGWNIAYLIPGLFIFISCIIALKMKEPRNVNDVLIFDRTQYKTEFTKKSTWWITLLMVLTGAGLTLTQVFSTYLDESAGLNLDDVGIGLSLAALGTFIGAVPTGIIGERFKLKNMMIFTTVLFIGGIAFLGFVPTSNTTLLLVSIVLLGVFTGAYEATQLRIAMEYSVGPISGTMYNWYMSISNIGQIALGANIIAIASVSFGYPIGMQFTSIFLVLGLLVGIKTLKNLNSTKPEKKAVEEEEAE